MTEASPLPKTTGPSPTALHGCPERAELVAFNRGTLSLALIKSVATHIKQCPLCEANLSTLQEEGETRHAPSPAVSPADQRVNVQIEDSVRSVLVDLPIDFSRSAPSCLAKGSLRILEAPLQLGQYRLMEKIGQGGMGVVYKAWHERLKREVAIKLLPLDEFDDARGIERFHQEMAAVGNVRHANVVFATDAGECEGVHFLVMEYVPGIDLAKLAAKANPLAVADACELIRQAAIGLEHIFRTGLVHRDLKPSNLMLSIDGTVKIMDLGLARLRPDLADGEEAASPRCLMGTIDFMSPEQSKDASLADIRSDIYSLGCTLFKLLCGQPPFGGEKFETVQEKLHGHRKLPPPKLGELRADIPAELESIVARALSKQPKQRFQSPLELATALAPLAKESDLNHLLHTHKSFSSDAAVRLPPDSQGTPATVSLLLDESRSVAAPSPVKEPAGEPQPVVLPAPPISHPWRARVALGSLLLVVILGVVYGVLAIAFSNSSPGRVPGLTKEMRFTKELEKTGEFKWINYDQTVSNIIVVDEPNQVLQLGSTGPQLVPVGKYPGGKGHFRFTIDGRDSLWAGSAGVFLGLRNELVPFGGVPTEVTMYQLISLEGRGGKGPLGMRVYRRKFIIDPSSRFMVPLDSIEASQDIAFPGRNVLAFDIALEQQGIRSITCNGVLLSKLTTAQENSLYKVPDDYQGPVGFFNYGHHGTKFSSVDISPFEP